MGFNLHFLIKAQASTRWEDPHYNSIVVKIFKKQDLTSQRPSRGPEISNFPKFKTKPRSNSAKTFPTIQMNIKLDRDQDPTTIG